jgi:hypothetical protein
MDTSARVAVDYVERWDTDTLWRHDTVTVNGEQRLAVPLTAVAIADSTAHSCRRLEGAAQAYATACDSTIASLYEEMTALKNKWFAARIVPPPPPPPSTVRPTLTYALLFAGADYANRQFHFDVDRGGYVDSWRTMDKLAHFAFGSTLAITAVDMGVKPKWAIALTCAGAAGFEWSQGHASARTSSPAAAVPSPASACGTSHGGSSADEHPTCASRLAPDDGNPRRARFSTSGCGGRKSTAPTAARIAAACPRRIAISPSGSATTAQRGTARSRTPT